MEEKFNIRLQKAMDIRNMKASELSEKANIPKSAISQYLSGLYEAKQKSIFKLAKALNVNEAWLMGFDVPLEEKKNTSQKDDFRYANHNGINTDGLNKDEIEEINRFVEFIRNKKKNEEK